MENPPENLSWHCRQSNGGEVTPNCIYSGCPGSSPILSQPGAPEPPAPAAAGTSAASSAASSSDQPPAPAPPPLRASSGPPAPAAGRPGAHQPSPLREDQPPLYQIFFSKLNRQFQPPSVLRQRWERLIRSPERPVRATMQKRSSVQKGIPRTQA